MTTKKTKTTKEAAGTKAKSESAQKANSKAQAKPKLGPPTNQRNADPRAPWPKCAVCGAKDAKGVLFLTLRHKESGEEKQTVLPIHGEKKRGPDGKGVYARPCVDVAVGVSGDDFDVVGHRVVKSPRLQEELGAKAEQREEQNRADFSKTMAKMFGAGDTDTSNDAMKAAMEKAQAEAAPSSGK